VLITQGDRNPAIATHDETMIDLARRLGRRPNGLHPTVFEFQMLYGIRRDLQTMLVKAGYRVRVYVPFGTGVVPLLYAALRANIPANVWFVLRGIFGRNMANYHGGPETTELTEGLTTEPRRHRATHSRKPAHEAAA